MRFLCFCICCKLYFTIFRRNSCNSCDCCISRHPHLRTAARGDLAVPATRTLRYGPRSFAVAGPSTWNSLPAPIRSCKTYILVPSWCENWTVYESVSPLRSWMFLAVRAGEHNFSTHHHHHPHVSLSVSRVPYCLKGESIPLISDWGEPKKSDRRTSGLKASLWTDRSDWRMMVAAAVLLPWCSGKEVDCSCYLWDQPGTRALSHCPARGTKWSMSSSQRPAQLTCWRRPCCVHKSGNATSSTFHIARSGL